MDFGLQNSQHLYAAPQTLLQPQPQPQPQSQQPQAAAAHLYSPYFITANPNPYPNTIVRHEDPSASSIVFADGSVSQDAEHYAAESGYDPQAVSYDAYQQHQHAAAYPYAQALAAASFQQAKRKLKIHSNILDLEEKKQKIITGGASADAIRICTICNIVCNSDKVFTSHLSGEKHALKALGANYPTMAPKVRAHMKQINYAKKLTPKASNKISSGFIGAAPKTPKPVQSFICEVCKIDCNSQETLNNHKMGKKHKGKLQKLQEKITPKPPVVSVVVHDQIANVESSKKSSSTKEGLQTKKDKMVHGGAAEEAIMVCALCDVVCNSKFVYESHVSGKKHLSTIKKQENRV